MAKLEEEGSNSAIPLPVRTRSSPVGRRVDHVQEEEEQGAHNATAGDAHHRGADEPRDAATQNVADGRNEETAKEKEKRTTEEEAEDQEPLVGITIDTNEKFLVPHTATPLHKPPPLSKWTLADALKWAPVLNIILLFLPLSKYFWLCYFLVWRFAYDVGLGLLLHKQSQSNAMIEWFKRVTHPEATFYGVIKKLIGLNMGPDYDFKKCPPAYNSWLAFRLIGDFVLAMDLAAYIGFCIKCFKYPELDLLTALCFTVGALLIAFSLWAKVDAYRVVSDYAWYWGDFFFLVQKQLTFDRVFSMAPHPMYTIGYSFFYGMSLVTRSFTVLYVSLFAHLLQLLFLQLVETPHMKKIYADMVTDPDPKTKTILYDTKTGYFRKDLIVFKNFDPLRSSDIFMGVIILYSFILLFFNIHYMFFICQVIVWRLIHSFGLGYILYRQSKNKEWIATFFAHGFTKQEAFENWKRIYNLSLTMTWVSFFCLAWKFAEFPESFIYGAEYFWLRQTIGIILIAINVWSSVSTFEVLGEYGWFYADFFIDEVPSKLYYTGIYRFLNNPEVITGFAGYYGMTLMANSGVVFAMALFCHCCNWLFIAKVERPHMKKLYGTTVRQTSGVSSAIKSIVEQTIDETPGLQHLTPKVEELKRRASNLTKEILDKIQNHETKKGR